MATSQLIAHSTRNEDVLSISSTERKTDSEMRAWRKEEPLERYWIYGLGKHAVDKKKTICSI